MPEPAVARAQRKPRNKCMADRKDELVAVGLGDCCLRKYERNRDGKASYYWEAKLPTGIVDVKGRKTHTITVTGDTEEDAIAECELWLLTAMQDAD